MIHETDLEVLRSLGNTLPVGGALTPLVEATNLKKPTVSRVLTRLRAKFGLRLPLSLNYPALGLVLYASIVQVNPRNYAAYQKAVQDIEHLSTYRLFGGENFWQLSLHCMIPAQTHRLTKTLNRLRSWNWVHGFQIIPAAILVSQLHFDHFEFSSQAAGAHESEPDYVIEKFLPHPRLDRLDLACLDYFQPDLLNAIPLLAKREEVPRAIIETRMHRLFRTLFLPQIRLDYEKLNIPQTLLVWINALETSSTRPILELFKLFPSHDVFVGGDQAGTTSVLAILRYSKKNQDFYWSVLNRLDASKAHVLFFETPNHATLLPSRAFPLNLAPREGAKRICWEEVPSTQIL